jgi:hypothetical protein
VKVPSQRRSPLRRLRTVMRIPLPAVLAAASTEVWPYPMPWSNRSERSSRRSGSPSVSCSTSGSESPRSSSSGRWWWEGSKSGAISQWTSESGSEGPAGERDEQVGPPVTNKHWMAPEPDPHSDFGSEEGL